MELIQRVLHKHNENRTHQCPNHRSPAAKDARSANYHCGYRSESELTARLWISAADTRRNDQTSNCSHQARKHVCKEADTVHANSCDEGCVLIGSDRIEPCTDPSSQQENLACNTEKYCQAADDWDPTDAAGHRVHEGFAHGSPWTRPDRQREAGDDRKSGQGGDEIRDVQPENNEAIKCPDKQTNRQAEGYSARDSTQTVRDQRVRSHCCGQTHQGTNGKIDAAGQNDRCLTASN